MCGICGIIQFQSSASASKRKALVAKMNHALLHRGPDAEGYYQSQEAHLAMRRLAISDQAGGNQPIYNADKSIAIVFNGEIYNYRSLKEVHCKDYVFKSNTDSEVVLALYAKFKEDCVNYLNGMFAFAIYDTVDNKFFIARDVRHTACRDHAPIHFFGHLFSNVLFYAVQLHHGLKLTIRQLQ